MTRRRGPRLLPWLAIRGAVPASLMLPLAPPAWVWAAAAPPAVATPGPVLAPAYQIDQVRFRYTHYEQYGVGFQSAAGPVGQPGSERTTIEQPQAEVIAHLGDRVTERLWVPIDAVTAASPDHSRYGRPIDAPPPDAVTAASRINVAGSFDALTSYRADHVTEIAFRAAFHLEEPFESWGFGLGATRSFADGNTVLGVGVNQLVDWFDRFDLAGGRRGRGSRSTTNANLTLTQLLSATTVAAISYGGTLQTGTLGNTWSSVLLADGSRAEERLPTHRQRHALAGRLAQWLPWQGALKLGYRAYLDGWGAVAHTTDAELAQRLAPWLRARVSYRFHHQSAVRFFTTAAAAGASQRTGDSDLARFHAQTWGGALAVDLPIGPALGSSPSRSSPLGAPRDLHFDLGYERYFRSNNLSMDMISCGLGFRF